MCKNEVSCGDCGVVDIIKGDDVVDAVDVAVLGGGSVDTLTQSCLRSTGLV